MLTDLLYIVWTPGEIAFRLGPLAVRWYSLCWLVGLVLCYFFVKWLYREQKVKDELFDPLLIYCFIGILVGARLGHCLFYEPEYFLSSGRHIVEMLLPIQFDESGEWHFTGYSGLASHGGTLGLMAMLLLYSRNTGMRLWHVLDDIALATPIAAFFIRMGNLMNSEIVGKVTDVPWAFIFVNGHPSIAHEPRHPGQLYEALAYACFFFVQWWFYRRRDAAGAHRHPVGNGFYFGLCLTLIFTFRFFIEYTKEIQVNFESGMTFNMGQLLSVPLILLGVWCMVRSRKTARS